MNYPLSGGKNQHGSNGHRVAKKPISLFIKLFSTLKPDIIIDPFAGFGNSIYAAQKLGLEIYACDIDASLKWDKTVNVNTYFKKEET